MSPLTHKKHQESRLRVTCQKIILRGFQTWLQNSNLTEVSLIDLVFNMAWHNKGSRI